MHAETCVPWRDAASIRHMFASRACSAAPLPKNGAASLLQRLRRSRLCVPQLEWYVNGEAYFAMTALPAVDVENLSTMTRKAHKLVDSGLEHLVRHDECLWWASEHSAHHCQLDAVPFSWSCSAAWSS